MFYTTLETLVIRATVKFICRTPSRTHRNSTLREGHSFRFTHFTSIWLRTLLTTFNTL